MTEQTDGTKIGMSTLPFFFVYIIGLFYILDLRLNQIEAWTVGIAYVMLLVIFMIYVQLHYLEVLLKRSIKLNRMKKYETKVQKV